MHDLTNIDIWSFCKLSQFIEKKTLLSQFKRLSESVLVCSQNPEAHWLVKGFRGLGGRCELELKGSFSASLSCRVCDKPVEQVFEFSRSLLMCKTEQQADAFDNENDAVDAVVPDNRVNLLDWVEDEMLLILPMFVTHQRCKDLEVDALSGVNSVASVDGMPELGSSECLKKPNPFAVLASLKRPSS